MNLQETEKEEIAKFKEDFDKILGVEEAKALALASIAESLIVLKNKIGRKLL